MRTSGKRKSNGRFVIIPKHKKKKQKQKGKEKMATVEYITTEEREIFRQLRELELHIPTEFVNWREFFRSHASYMMEFRRFLAHYKRTPMANFKLITDYSTEPKAENSNRGFGGGEDEDWEEYYRGMSMGGMGYRQSSWPYNFETKLVIGEPIGFSEEEHTAF